MMQNEVAGMSIAETRREEEHAHPTMNADAAKRGKIIPYVKRPARSAEILIASFSLKETPIAPLSNKVPRNESCKREA